MASQSPLDLVLMQTLGLEHLWQSSLSRGISGHCSAQATGTMASGNLLRGNSEEGTRDV